MQSVKDVSPATKHGFLHYTIQEYLAAYHIAQLEPEQQREAVEELLQTSPLSATLPFYAGLTNLKNKEVFKVLLKVMDKPLDLHSVSKHLTQHVNEYGSDPRRLLVALMNCIYESEIHQLYTQVQPQVEQAIYHPVIQLNFSVLYLTPTDCLSIGCFLRHTKINNVMPVLFACNINDAAFKMLLLPVIKEQRQYNPYIWIHLDDNPITHKGFEFLRAGLGSRRLALGVNGCLSSSSHPHTHVNIFKALANLIECVSRTFSPDFGLLISNNEITAEHKFYLLLLILCGKSLEILQLGWNNLRGCMPLLAPALNYSNLRILDLSYCYLDDNDVICLGRAFQKNLTLTSLYIHGNKISAHAFSEFLLAIQNSAISDLFYNGHITEAHTVMLSAISNNRDTAHMSPLHLHNNRHEILSLAEQTFEHITSLPPEFATGQEGITNLYPSESEQKTDTHPCLTQ